MSIVIGIDTGGTYTDAVLLDTEKREVLKKAKAFTTMENLSIGIRNSVAALGVECIEAVEKVVLSTTLATNSVVENKIRPAGLILIGKKPDGELATEHYCIVGGRINVKGRELTLLEPEEVLKEAEKIIPHVEALAVSGLYSVRNPIHEIEAKRIILSAYDIPIVCGHELANDLGYLERTNTTVINAGLLPVISDFLKAIKAVLKELNADAPVFAVRGDGSIAKIDVIEEKPVDTILSGPAASTIGAMYLTGMGNAIVADMGGTTTDTAMLIDNSVKLAPKGASVGKWRLKIKSAELNTFGLGGDSEIKAEDRVTEVGPRRVLPACRGGGEVITPTDILHCTGEFVEWNSAMSKSSMAENAKRCGVTETQFIDSAEFSVEEKIYSECVEKYGNESLPVIGIGAPAKTWFTKASQKFGFELMVPESFEVANAVGAAAAGIREVEEAIVRRGEGRNGYLAHTRFARFFSANRQEAVGRAVLAATETAVQAIRRQGMETVETEVSIEDVYATEQAKAEKDESLYVETKISVEARGNTFKSAP